MKAQTLTYDTQVNYSMMLMDSSITVKAQLTEQIKSIADLFSVGNSIKYKPTKINGKVLKTFPNWEVTFLGVKVSDISALHEMILKIEQHNYKK